MTNSDAESGETTDPMEGADVGETRHIVRDATLHGINYIPMWDVGYDRDGDADIVGAEVVENDDGYNDIKITFEGDVTKTLPPEWDKRKDPVTEGEKQTQRRKEWLGKVGSVASLLLPVVIVAVVMVPVMNAMSGALTINDQPVTFDPMAMLPAVLVIFGTAALIVFAIKYAPGMAGRRWSV